MKITIDTDNLAVKTTRKIYDALIDDTWDRSGINKEAIDKLYVELNE